MSKPLTGEQLKFEIRREDEQRKPLIDGLLYEGSVLMIASDPGVGKSTFTACAIAQASTGLSVFGFLDTPRPLRIYYLPSERGSREIIERFRDLESEVAMTYENIMVDDTFMGKDLTTKSNADELITHITSTAFKPDIIVLDPIYGFVAGGLSKDEKASEFCRFSSRLQTVFNCSIWLLHHTTKESYASDGSTIVKADPFYGSQWLKAHVTASFYMKKTQRGVSLIQKKDSHSNLHDLIELEYNPETHVLTALNIESNSNKKVRALTFLRRMKSTNRRFTFNEFMGCLLPVSNSHARQLLVDTPISDLLIKHKTLGQKTLYEVKQIDF